MPSTITGNLGGASSSGVQVTAYSSQSGLILNNADASGNFTFSNLPAGTYTLKAQDGSGKVNYLASHQVIADGSSTYSGINFNPTAVNAGGTKSGYTDLSIPNPNGTPTF